MKVKIENKAKKNFFLFFLLYKTALLFKEKNLSVCLCLCVFYELPKEK